MKILFICNQNKNRSKTAEELFRNKFETKSAGLYNTKPLNEKELEWANLVVVMEDNQRSEIANRFPNSYLKKQIISLNIPDIYSYNQKELIDILQTKLNEVMNLTIY
ncbi:MAG: phosphotyrosine protein phosphatase [Candidatus Nanoarchaeia archaeon]|nr:phosphotyrosine protein phosphatase [Candidatus Nanoarchaeia archaeon]